MLLCKRLKLWELAKVKLIFFKCLVVWKIPFQAKLLAQTGKYDILVAAGFIVDGGIYRHEFVSQTVLDALMHVQLETEVPILSVVLTPQRFHESEEHKAFFLDHFRIKGSEAAEACVQTLENVGQFA